jgi:glycosyltransferase involved in cell wall biosynthesis
LGLTPQGRLGAGIAIFGGQVRPPAPAGPSKETIVQSVLDRIGGGTYLEIGVRRGRSFAPISARRKIGVDPRLPLTPLRRLGHLLARRLPGSRSPLWFGLTSDAFFRRHARLLAGSPIDVALVDGLHTYEQALRDVDHCLEHLSPGGVVVMHDCNPTTPAMAHPAPSVEAVRALGLPGWDGRWCGDVWKAVVHLRSLREDLRVFVLDCDYGVGVVTRGVPESRLGYSPAEVAALGYADLEANRTELLNLRPPDHLQAFLAEARARLLPGGARVNVFLKGPRSQATPRYRGFLMAEALQRGGLGVVVHAPVVRPRGGRADRLRELGRLARGLWSARSGVVYLVRTVYHPHFTRMVWVLKRVYGTRVVFDFDDAKYLVRPRQIRRLTRLADAVVVGSHALAEWAGRHNARVHIVPTSVPFEVYSRFTHDYEEPRDGPPRVGWIGTGPDHLANLALVEPALLRLQEAGIPLRFVLIGALGRREVYDVFARARANGVDVEFVDELDWSRPELAAREIGRFEVGVMPLVDTEHNRCKCAFKAVEYMACGVATLCSAVGENLHVVEDGRTGLLARTPDDWYEKLATLLCDRHLAARLGRAGQQEVRVRYSLEANAPRLVEVIARLDPGRPRA